MFGVEYLLGVLFTSFSFSLRQSMEFGPAHLMALINLAALVWGAAKLHASVQDLVSFKKDVLDTLDDHEDELASLEYKQAEDIAHIDLRVSLIEQEIDGLTPPVAVERETDALSEQ